MESVFSLCKSCTNTPRKAKNTHADTLVTGCNDMYSNSGYSSEHKTDRKRWACHTLIHSCKSMVNRTFSANVMMNRSWIRVKTTHVIHEHDDNVWRWNSWWLLCPGTTYYCTKESQSLSRHHSHCCALVIWASTSRKWFVCLRAGLQRNICAYAVELNFLSTCYFNSVYVKFFF